ncbi:MULTISPECIES: hypothetical protein [unclassified Microbacterium]|uniref:hypothetical protein n=1 Tax=unclassified Microbacterium TaxID=2609290 RepID=UPI0009776991|nr:MULTISPECIES: hypothetical protein [unclassified Microbacterium]
MAVSVQSGSNFVPVLWTLIPVVLALGISAYRHALLGRKRLYRAQDYLPRIVLERFALAAFAPMWQVFLAPALLVRLVVGVYGASPFAEESTLKLVRTQMKRLRRSGKTITEAGAADVLGVLGAVLSAQPDQQS